MCICNSIFLVGRVQPPTYIVMYTASQISRVFTPPQIHTILSLRQVGQGLQLTCTVYCYCYQYYYSIGRVGPPTCIHTIYSHSKPHRQVQSLLLPNYTLYYHMQSVNAFHIGRVIPSTYTHTILPYTVIPSIIGRQGRASS